MSLCRSLVLFALFALLCAAPKALHAASPVAAAPCPRYHAGATVADPKDLYSRQGILRVTLTYRTRVDSTGQTLFCFMSDDGSQSPTLHLAPGDELLLTLRNALPPSTTPSFQNPSMPGMSMGTAPELSISGQRGAGTPPCTSSPMTDTSVNLHYHGTNTPPTCHQDEVIKTIVNSGETFQYDLHIPLDEPPGLYWYHPHVHGISEAALQGGASGALIVEGLQNINPAVAGLPERTLLIRDYPTVTPDADNGTNAPAWDLSLNYIPVTYPQYRPAVLAVEPSQKQLWRIVNAGADTVLDLAVLYDGTPQPLHIVAIDGVPTGSQDGLAEGRSIAQSHFLLAPSSRVEFILATPSTGVHTATLVTRSVPTGPDGDSDPDRPIARIVAREHLLPQPHTIPAVSAPPQRQRFADLAAATPTRERKLFFSEVLSDPSDPNSPTNFYITVDGARPTLFDPSNPPAITTTQGSVEDWTIENRALENHEFHMHQLHFLVLEQNGRPGDGQYRDVINVPFWSGSGPFPSVKLRMDFRGADIGDFVYHCHILGHEDSGMMAIIRVLAR